MEKQKNKILWNKKTLIGLSMFMLFTATLLSFIVAFVGEYIKPMMGSKITNGFGIILLTIAWALWFDASKSKKKISFSMIALPIITIVSIILLPSILTITMGVIIIVSSSTYLLLNYLKPEFFE